MLLQLHISNVPIFNKNNVFFLQRNVLLKVTDYLNCGKKSICIDLKQLEGIKIVKKLATNADIIIEPFRPGKNN